jgi:hypothetical protein
MGEKMKGWDELGLMEKAERLREVLEAVLKDLHYAPGLAAPSTRKLVLLEKNDGDPRS